VEKFGIAGYGGRGRLIARKLVDLGFEVCGVYDSNPAQLADAPFTTFMELGAFLKLDLDVLAVATWPSSHVTIVVQALECGLDVFVEKPMGATLSQSLEVVQTQRRAGRLVVVGYVERLNPAIMKLRDVADLAEVVRSREIRVGLTPPGMDGPGVLLDLASHGIDMAYHLFGVEPGVRGSNFTVPKQGHAEYECMVELDCGHTRSLVEARYASIRRRRLELETEHEYYEVTYTPAALKIGFPPPKLRRRPRNFEDLEQLSKNVEIPFDVRRKEPIKAMLQLLAESVRKGRVLDPLCSGEQALVTARVMDEAKKAPKCKIIERAHA